MATSFYNTKIDHTSDAEFRAWAQAFSDSLDTVGLTATADTGQINLATVLRPGSNVAAGYQIRKLVSTVGSDIFIKIEFGTGTTTTSPQIWITCGTGSDGAGTITGGNFPRTTMLSGTPFNTTSLYPTWVCKLDGCFWFQFKAGFTVIDSTVAQSSGFFSITRSVDDTGALTNDNIVYSYRSSTTSTTTNLNVVAVATNTQIHLGVEQAYCLIAGNVTSSYVLTDLQAYRWYYPAPRVRPLFSHLTILTTEGSKFDTFNTAPVGSTVKTFVVLGHQRNAGIPVAAANSQLCMIWQ